MYPTVVIVLVETCRSMTDLCEISPSNTSNPAGHSAAGPVHTTTDNESGAHALQSQGAQEHDLDEVVLELSPQVGTSG